ncbi:MAG TPA: hypothetical protein VHZ31_02335 [Solirubrobacteraceae bacterium]|jgi:hypothetical protein|nr:hypothetical protein [Solirubrobacteraceae bacterium]
MYRSGAVVACSDLHIELRTTRDSLAHREQIESGTTRHVFRERDDGWDPARDRVNSAGAVIARAWEPLTTAYRDAHRHHQDSSISPGVAINSSDRRSSGRRIRSAATSRIRLVALGAVAVLVMFSCFSAAARASSPLSWSGPVTLDPGQARVPDIACPSAAQCTMLDAQGYAITFDPAAPSSRSRSSIDSPGAGLTSIACPSTRQCTAVDSNGDAITFDPTAPGSESHVAIDANVLSSVACSSTTQCTAVDIVCPAAPDLCTSAGSVEREFTFDPRSSGVPTPVTVDTGAYLISMACPSATQCTAIDEHDGGREITFNPTAVGAPSPAVVAPEEILLDIACPSTSQCTAIDWSGEEVTFDPTSPAAVKLKDISNAGLRSVSCPSSTQCTAVEGGDLGDLGDATREFTFNPSAPGTPTPVTIDMAHFGTGGDVVCPATSQCTVVLYGGYGGGEEVTFDPTAPAPPTPANVDPGGFLGGIACPSDNECVAVDTGGDEVTVDPATPSAPTLETIAIERDLSDVACPSTTQCTAIERYLDRATGAAEVTFDPHAPGTPAPVPLDVANDLNSVACPSTTQCTAVGDGGDVITFDPHASGVPASATIGTGRLSGVACPSTTQCTVIGDDTVTFDPASPGTTINTLAGEGGDAIACPSTTQCTVAGDGEADTFDPVSAVTPTSTMLGLGTESLQEIADLACPSPTQCTVVGFREDPSGEADSDEATFDAVTFDPTTPGTAVPTLIGMASTIVGADVACSSTAQCVAVDGSSGYIGTSATDADATPPVNSASPTISGTPVSGQTLTAVRGAWANSPTGFSYQWEDCDTAGDACSPIAGATGQAYVLAAGDVGHTIRVLETASNAGGASSPASVLDLKFVS